LLKMFHRKVSLKSQMEAAWMAANSQLAAHKKEISVWGANIAQNSKNPGDVRKGAVKLVLKHGTEKQKKRSLRVLSALVEDIKLNIRERIEALELLIEKRADKAAGRGLYVLLPTLKDPAENDHKIWRLSELTRRHRKQILILRLDSILKAMAQDASAASADRFTAALMMGDNACKHLFWGSLSRDVTLSPEYRHRSLLQMFAIKEDAVNRKMIKGLACAAAIQAYQMPEMEQYRGEYRHRIFSEGTAPQKQYFASISQ